MTSHSLATRASLFADPTRATMCLALHDGRARTVGELARLAGVAPSTASEHLNLLVAGGVLVALRQGRHRYVRLADATVADLIEEFAGPPAAPVGLRQVRAAERLAAGRTCYDHLAGDLGVAVHDALTDRGLLTSTGLTDAGREWFCALLGNFALVPGRRPLVRQCLDWTRRVPHLGGALGGALTRHMFERGWLIRPADDRAVRLTQSGAYALGTLLEAPLPAGAVHADSSAAAAQ